MFQDMDDLFGQIDYRSKSDAIVMRLLRSAMDKAHENVQSMNGPMEFLHERSKFYELAAILVEGGLNIVQEEADIQETSREKILSDLMEIKDWLQRRNEEMRLLIIEKDKELLERIESELKLRETLEVNQRELEYLREKEDLERTKSEGYQEFLESSQGIPDEAKEEDIHALKTSVDQQVWNIKQKLEDEKRSITNTMRKNISNVSDSELYSKLSSLSVEDDHLHWDDHFSGVKTLCRTLDHGKYNTMIRQMSSDIDILKGTFDIAFGRMQNVEVLPLEKRWKMIIERYTILLSVKGFTRDVQKIFDAEFKKRNHCIPSGFCKEKWRELIHDMTTLAQELKALCSQNKVRERRFKTYESSGTSLDMRRTVSEPLPQVPFKLPEKETGDTGTGSLSVAKMIKNHESIIEKHGKKWSWLTKEMLRGKEFLSAKRGNEPDELETRIQKAIRKLDSIIEWNNNLIEEIDLCDAVNNSHETSSENPQMPGKASDEISLLKEDRDCLNLQILLMEEIYFLVFEGFMKNLKVELCDHCDKNFILPDSSSHTDDNNHSYKKAGEHEELTSSEMLLQYLDHNTRGDVFAVYTKEITKDWKKCTECKAEECLLQEEIYKLVLDESVKCIQSSGNLLINQVGNEDSETFTDAVESQLREDVHMAYFREMSKAWETERDDYNIEMIIREDMYEFLMVEVVKESNVITRESETLNQINITKDFPSVTDSDIHRDDSLSGNLDSLLEDYVEDGYLMVKSTSQTNEQSATTDVISPSEDVDEQNIKQWLLTDGEKLEKVLHEVQTSKALLLMLGTGNTLVQSSDYEEQDGSSTQLNDIVAVEPESQNTSFLEDDEMLQLNQYVLSPLIGFQQKLVDFEHIVHTDLESKSLRMQALKQQISELVQPVASIKKRKLLYKKAFIARCQNLSLAENEVDLLGNQVDKLVCLLQRIYLTLNQNSAVLSRYFGVFDILNLIRTELAEGAA